jgi:SOS-response transcriptional repressor LexA
MDDLTAPPAGPVAPRLTPSLRRLAEAIRDWPGNAGPPTIDELAERLGCVKSTVSEGRKQLRELGLADFDPGKRRSTRLTTDPAVLATHGLAPPAPVGAVTDLARFRSRRARLGGTRASRRPAAGGEPLWRLPEWQRRRLPLAGRISAGPARGVRPEDEQLEVDGELAGPGQYALRVSGDSMIELGIYDGDHAIVDPEQPVHHGDLVAALLPGEAGDGELATLKVLEVQDGQAWLVAANPAYPPIPLRQAMVVGRVTTTIRRF